MGFFTKWISPGEQIMFCFDVPPTLHDSLQVRFLSPSTTPKLFDVYSLHVVVIDEIIKLLDKSVWSLRDTVRVTELVMLPNYPAGKPKAVNNHFQNRLDAAQQGPNFPLLHDFARHTVHSSETLDVAIDTMVGILGQHEFLFIAPQNVQNGTPSSFSMKLTYIWSNAPSTKPVRSNLWS